MERPRPWANAPWAFAWSQSMASRFVPGRPFCEMCFAWWMPCRWRRWLPKSEFGVPLFVVGLISASLSDRFQRLGDMAAGTMVVVDQTTRLTGVLKFRDERVAQIAESIPSGFQVHRTLGLALSIYVQRRKVLSRARRQEISRHLGEPLCRQFDLPPDTDHDCSCAVCTRRLSGILSGNGSRCFGNGRCGMRVLERLESRRRHWQELEQLCAVMEGGWRKAPPAANVSRFADLYRSACADLALADAYQLPPATIQYLHQLVGRAHNQLYRHESPHGNGWFQELFVNVPRRLYADGCLRLALAMFWGVFLLCAFLAWRDPDFAPRIVGKGRLLSIERQYSTTFDAEGDERTGMAGFYGGHNSTIGLRCFAFGLLAGIGGLYETVFNAATLGAMFGYMGHSPYASNFFHFVTAHGPFELTAVVLMAAAGMRLGFSRSTPADAAGPTPCTTPRGGACP